jgi:hypothetical protein
MKIFNFVAPVDRGCDRWLVRQITDRNGTQSGGCFCLLTGSEKAPAFY